ncbi:MAG: methionyl-tRNA formyltransferase [Pseudomonadales bacterium]|nr:methionyl-tRNA formyltransferase [Pseudomonadales bacterium]
MRLIIMGQQAFGKACLEAVLGKGEDEVVAVYCAPDRENKPLDPIREFALEKGIPVIQLLNFKDKEVLDEMRSLNADLCIMAYVTLFVPEVARDIPIQGSICFHPSLLPEHRGPSSINWAIISGATKTGLTIFWPSDGLDEGDILLQKEVEVDPDDTLGIVYFQKIFQLGVEAVLEAINLVRSGNPPRIKQDESKATYESWCKHEHVKIDWTRPVTEIYNLIRGTNPQPGAWTIHNGEVLKIFDCTMVEASGSPGEVNEVSEEGFTVTASGGGILIQRVRPVNDKKINAFEYASKCGLSGGTILGE